MSDDFDLKIFETKAELAELKEEIREIQSQNNALKNEMALRTLLETVSKIQSDVEVLSKNFKEMQETVTTLSNRDSNYNEKFFELNENLRKMSENLEKYDTILTQHNEILTKQSEAIQVLKTSANNLEKQTILLLGGQDGKNWNSLLMLENNGQNWKQLNIKLPYAVRSHGAQFLNNNIYIFGGFADEKHLNCTYKLSKSLKWEKVADMNQKRSYISNSSVILNNQIWVCGGGNREESTLKSVEMYDPLTNKWKYMKEMNQCRQFAAAAVVNGKIFCSGDLNGLNSSNSVECYDPSSDVWTPICNMPQEIWGHGAVEMNGNLIVIGGWNGSECLNSVWALVTTNKDAVWIKKPSMSIPREGFSIAKIHHKIFVCGGYDGPRVDDVEIFDGEVWRNGPKMPTIRANTPAVVIPMEFGGSLN